MGKPAGLRRAGDKRSRHILKLAEALLQNMLTSGQKVSVRCLSAVVVYG